MYSPIPVLNELKDLYDSTRDYLADGFELYDYDDKGRFPQELEDPAFLRRVAPGGAA